MMLGYTPVFRFCPRVAKLTKLPDRIIRGSEPLQVSINIIKVIISKGRGVFFPVTEYATSILGLFRPCLPRVNL